MASGWGASGIACLLLLGVTAVALLLLLVVLPIRDGTKASDSAWETYSELRSMSYEAGWKIDSEMYSVQARAWMATCPLSTPGCGRWASILARSPTTLAPSPVPA